MRRPLYLLPVAALLGLSALPLSIAAALTTANLPGGTPISVAIDNPADGALLPPGPVAVSGTASVGVGVPQRNTGLVYVLDVSGSTRQAGCDSSGGVAGDRRNCEVAAAKALNDRAARDGTIDKVGLVVFGDSAAHADFSDDEQPGQPATDLQVTSPEDSHVNEVLDSVTNTPQGHVGKFKSHDVGSGTVFSAAVTEAVRVADQLGTQNKIVVFMSDGADGEPAHPGQPDPLETALDHVNGVVFKTFAIGQDTPGNPVSCGNVSSGEPAVDTLARISFRTGGGRCTDVTNISDLLTALPAVINSQLNALSLIVDGHSDDITDVSQRLPAVAVDQPVSVTYNATITPLSPGPHTICVKADGHDSGQANHGDGSVTECHTVHINEPPVVSAGGPYSGPEDNPVPINGTVSDPDGPFPTSTSWSILPATGIPPDKQPVCTFGDAGAVSTTVTCSERGTYTLTLTASDGLHAPVSSSTTVTFINQAPRVSAGGPYSGNEDNAVPIAGTVTDPDGPSLTTRWSIEAGTDVPTPFNCTFGDAAALSTTVTCDQHGTYRLTLTASDSVNAPVAATTTVTFINVPPTVSAGGPYKGNQGNQVPIVGTATDPDGPPLTSTWTIEPVNDGSVPEGSVCTFANPNALSTTVSCTERGNYTLTLTVTDGVNKPVSATANLTLVNVPSTVSAGGPYTGEEDHPVAITGTVVDPDSPGLTTTWTIKPNLGTAICSFTDPAQLSTVVTCSEPGVYTLTLTADDPADGNPAVVATAVVSLSLTPGALSLISSVAPAPGFVGGDAIVVTQTVHNAGPAAMPGVRLTTTLPTGMQPTSVDLPGCTAASCDLGTLAPGQTVQVRFSFSPSATVDTLVSATVTTPGPDLDRGDNSGSVRIVIRQPTLTIDPSTGPQGFVTHAIGKDFPPGARVRLQWSIGISETPGEVTVRPDGTLDAQALVFPKDVRGLRNLQAVPVSGANFGMVTSNPFLVFLPSLKPLSFVIR